MTTVIITTITAVLGCVVAVCTYFAGQKKSSNADTAESAFFQGEVTAKLDQLIKSVEKLEQKLSRNTGELHAEIDKKIADHERRYHNARNDK